MVKAMAKKEDEMDSFIEQLKKDLGSETQGLSVLSDPANAIVRDPTGILLLDWVAGKGIPRGRWVEIFGKESGGKSLIAALICANAQKRGDVVAWLDMERAADNEWFKRIGVDTSKMLLAKPTSAENAFTILEKLICSGKIRYIVLDSIASLVTESEITDDPGKQNMAIMARLLSTEMRKLTGKLDKHQCTVILINQTRSTMATTRYAQQEATTGGKAIPYYSSIRLVVSKLTDPASWVTNANGDVIAHTIRIKGIKNKVGSPNKVGQFLLIYSGGPDNRTSLITLAKAKKFITVKGSMYYIDYNGQSLSARGEKDLVEKITANTELQKFLFDALDIDKSYRDMFKNTNTELLKASGISEIAEMPDSNTDE